MNSSKERIWLDRVGQVRALTATIKETQERADDNMEGKGALLGLIRWLKAEISAIDKATPPWDQTKVSEEAANQERAGVPRR